MILNMFLKKVIIVLNKNNTNYEAIYGYTPLVVLLNKDGIKDISVGYSDYDTFKEFLNNNDIK